MTQVGQGVEDRRRPAARSDESGVPALEPPMPEPLSAPARITVPLTTPGGPDERPKPGRARRWQRAYARRLAVTDALVVTVVLVVNQIGWLDGLTLAVRSSGGLAVDLPYGLVTAALAVLWALSLSVAGSRETRVIGAGGDEYKRVIDGTMRLFGTMAIVLFLLDASAGHSYFFFALPAGLVLLILGRWISRKWLVRQRRLGRHTARAVLVGDRDATEHVICQLAQDTSSGLVIVGAVTENSGESTRRLAGGVPVLGYVDDLMDGIVGAAADAVIYTGARGLGPRRLRELGWQLDDLGIDLIVAPALTDIAGPRIHARPVAGVPLVRVDYPRFEGGRRVAKRALDIAVSSLALLVLSPFLVVIAVLIRADSPGGAVFRQTRVGLGGHHFRMIKFRSMVPDAESRLPALMRLSDGNGVMFKMRDDPRVTRIGRPLRRYSLDELPQLLNVLRGEMSLVGPRPPLACEVEQYDVWTHRRFLVKPGLTGPWQIRGRSDLCWEDSVRLDLYYVENWSLMGDLLILWKTLKVLLRPTGAY